MSLVQVTAPHFVAGLVFNGEKCIEAAPILKWCVGRSKGRIFSYCRSKGYTITII